MCFIVKRWEGFRLLYIFDHTWAQLSTSVHALWQRTVVFTSHLRIFHLYGDVNTSGEELHILTHARHSWPLSSEGSFACHTYCDTGLRFIMVISEDPWHSHLLPSLWQWSCHYLFLWQVCRYRGLNPDLLHARRTLYLYATSHFWQYMYDLNSNRNYSTIYSYELIMLQCYDATVLLHDLSQSCFNMTWLLHCSYIMTCSIL